MKTMKTLDATTPRPWLTIRSVGPDFIVEGNPTAVLGNGAHASTSDNRPELTAHWCWNGKILKAQSDRFGMIPVFYTVRPKAIIISGSIQELISHGASADLDMDALAVFFRLGYFLNEDTAFKDIRVMPPSATITWDGRLELTNHFHRHIQHIASYDQLLDDYISLFRDAVSKRLPRPDETFALPLSGGRDSRHILFELLRQKAWPRVCVTSRVFAPRLNQDVQVARSVTKALGLPHVVISPPSQVEAELIKNRLTHYMADEHAWAVGLRQILASYGTISYDGIGGDVLSASRSNRLNWITLYKHQKYSDLADQLLPRGTQSAEVLLSPRMPSSNVTEMVKERVIKELKCHADWPNPLAMFFFWNRTRREIALLPYGIFSNIRCFAPFLDNDLFDLLSSVPMGFSPGKQLHTDVLTKAYPQYRHLPFSPPETLRFSRPSYFTFWTAALSRGLLSSSTRYASYKSLHILARGVGREWYRLDNRWLVPGLLLYLQDLICT